MTLMDVRALSKQYGSLTAVDGVSFDIQEGEVFSLLGPNGAGKSTTIGMLSALIEPTRGDARIGGLSVRRRSAALRRLFGVVPQEIALYEELSAKDNLLFWGRLYGLRGADLRRRISTILETVGLADRAGSAIKTMSGGMKRRLNIAAGLLHEPRLVFMNEPTVGIDPQSSRTGSASLTMGSSLPWGPAGSSPREWAAMSGFGWRWQGKRRESDCRSRCARYPVCRWRPMERRSR